MSGQWVRELHGGWAQVLRWRVGPGTWATGRFRRWVLCVVLASTCALSQGPRFCSRPLPPDLSLQASLAAHFLPAPAAACPSCHAPSPCPCFVSPSAVDFCRLPLMPHTFPLQQLLLAAQCPCQPMLPSCHTPLTPAPTAACCILPPRTCCCHLLLVPQVRHPRAFRAACNR